MSQSLRFGKTLLTPLQERQIAELLKEKVCFSAIARQVNCSTRTVCRRAKQLLPELDYLILSYLGSNRKSTSNGGLKGNRNGNFKRGWKYTAKGYKMVLTPDWYTGKQYNGYVFEHQVNYCLAHELTAPPEGKVIHHIDYDKLNNQSSNLVAMTTEEHTALHEGLRNA